MHRLSHAPSFGRFFEVTNSSLINHKNPITRNCAQNPPSDLAKPSELANPSETHVPIVVQAAKDRKESPKLTVGANRLMSSGSAKSTKIPPQKMMWDLFGSSSDEEDDEDEDTAQNSNQTGNQKGSATTSNVVQGSDNGNQSDSESDSESEWTSVKSAKETALKKALDAERKVFRLAEEAQQKAAEAAEAAEQIRMNQEKFAMNAELLKKQAENNIRLNGLIEDTPVSQEVASKERHPKRLRPLDGPMQHPFTRQMCGYWTGHATAVFLALEKALDGKNISDEHRREIVASVTASCQKHLFTVVKKRVKQVPHKWNDNEAVKRVLYNHALKKATDLQKEATDLQKEVKKSNHSRARFHELVLVGLEAERIATTLNAKHLAHTFVTEELIKKCFCHKKQCAIYPQMPTDEPSILRIQQKAACEVMAFSITPEHIAKSKDYYLSIGFGKDAAKAATDDLNAIRKERMKKLERAVELAKKKKQTKQEHALKKTVYGKARCKLQNDRAELKKRLVQQRAMGKPAEKENTEEETTEKENTEEEPSNQTPSARSKRNLKEASRNVGKATRLMKETMPKRQGNRKARVLPSDEYPAKEL